MRVEQLIRRGAGWKRRDGARPIEPQLVLVFASRFTLLEPSTWRDLRTRFSGARVVACSTAGEIAGAHVLDDALVATAVQLEHGTIAVTAIATTAGGDSYALGEQLGASVAPEGLAHLFVLCDGTNVNGNAFVQGLRAKIPSGVPITGGLAADGARFERTAVCVDGPEPSRQVVAIGFYGERIRSGYGSVGGWEPFGPERVITRSSANVLYALDGEPALDLYERYLGDHATSLPASGLHFPLAVARGPEPPVVRTILGIDRAARSLIFAGDVPEGHRARLMRANPGRLVEGAAGAARESARSIAAGDADLAILVSCIGRKLVLKQRTEEELDAVLETVGDRAVIAGFYSYGEIAPFAMDGACNFHNQTMTVTTLTER